MMTRRRTFPATPAVRSTRTSRISSTPRSASGRRSGSPRGQIVSNRAVNEPSRSFHSAWRRPLLGPVDYYLWSVSQFCIYIASAKALSTFNSSSRSLLFSGHFEISLRFVGRSILLVLRVDNFVSPELGVV